VKVAIVGSRDYPQLWRVEKYVAELPKDTVVVSGAARGVDQVAAMSARRRGLEVIEFPADWDGEGRGAGRKRNWDVMRAAERVAVFWDGKSPGTAHAMEVAHGLGRPVVLFLPEGNNNDEATRN
jgi:hypothetical protein